MLLFNRKVCYNYSVALPYYFIVILGDIPLNIIRDKLNESLRSILPIAAIVFILSVTIIPMPTSTFLLFLFGVVCLVFGLSIFTMGAELSMQPLGAKIGAHLSQSKHIWLAALISLIIGILITVSEPDLQILAELVSGVPNMLLILTVSVGVGVFLVVAVFRIFFGVSLPLLLIVFYIVTFTLCFFVSPDFWAIAFDSGGVTTGPMTVPFIMTLGAGISSARTSKSSHDDSFGLIALCSIGPILSVLILGICYDLGEGEYVLHSVGEFTETQDGLIFYFKGFVEHAADVAIALLPIIAFTVLFQLFTNAYTGRQLVRIGVGVLYTFVGLVIFLTGANIGFLPVGYAIGETLGTLASGAFLIPLAMLLGFFIVTAEPAVHVLNKQVEQITAGAIPAKAVRLSLSIGVASALGLSMLRILTGISIMWILVPGYIISLALSFLVPRIFTGIAFDSGGVASGAMMSGFVLPMALGACGAIGGNIMTDAFGCVAFSAMTPIISIQISGLIFKLKSKSAVRRFISEEEYFIDYTEGSETLYG